MKYFVLVLLILACACSTCPPCVPEHEVVDNVLPVYQCPEPPVLDELILPDWPELPEDPTPDQIKAWYVRIVETYHVRFNLLIDRIETLDMMLDAYRQ